MIVLNRKVVKRVVASVDWGFTGPGVIQVWAIDGDARMYLVYEVYETKQTIDWWIETAQEIYRHFNVEVFVCDPAEPSYIQQFRNAGIEAIEGFNDIEPGIQAVRQRMKVADDGRPRIFFFNDAIEHIDENLERSKIPCGLLQELDGYVWDKKRLTEQVKELPVDKDNHACDAMRYAVAYVDDLGTFNLEVVGSPVMAVGAGYSPFKAV